MNARIIFYMIFSSSLVLVALYFGGFIINITKSYPLGFYKKTEGKYNKGDMVGFCLKENSIDYLKRIKKLPVSGGLCGTHPVVLKTVYGISEDIVSLDNFVSINGKKIENSNIKKSKLMAKYVSISNKSFKLEPGDYILLSTRHPDSFDSRYFGAVNRSRILFKVRPVWTF